ncbi:hypothetical protein BUALT_Bualt14G0082000 [Buddleja alternifolia]|uniref:Uncharacterized protein n=1 Tax=Buddleja alternifolia TaxID=168488 RepID=A0AAV6WPV7_9LAMI|nr:hypothetical protein BUALT_Bualt14G0082000 [Buddleja alternifolia]
MNVRDIDSSSLAAESVVKAVKMGLLCKKLRDLEHGNGSSSTMIFCNKLEEVNAEYLDDTLMEWRPLPCKKLLNGLISAWRVT